MPYTHFRRRKSQRKAISSSEVVEQRMLLSATQIADINQNPGFFYPDGVDFNGKFVFSIDHPSSGKELWISDGTDAGTFLLKDIQPGIGDSSPEILGEINGALIFSAQVSGDEQLWKTDGTPNGTVFVADITTQVSSDAFSFHQSAFYNGSFYFRGNDGVNGVELWKTDGTESGTAMVRNLRAGSDSSNPGALTVFRNEVYFSATSDSGGGLWKTDGTAAGTVEVLNNPVSTDTKMIAANGTLFFVAAEPATGLELWKTDGTPAGSELVKDINPGAASSFGSILEKNGLHVQAGDNVYFTANDGIHGVELWKSDGTAAGTVLIKDIEPGEASSEPNQFVTLNGLSYFVLYEGTDQHIWRTDGTEAGTIAMSDLIPVGTNEFIASLALAGDRLAANVIEYNEDGDAIADRLWTTDGSQTGSERIYSFDASVNGETYLFSVGDNVFFEAFEDGVASLWKSDGTVSGTQSVKSLYNPSSRIFDLVNVGGTAFFAADDGIHGRELWKSDGSSQNTSLVLDIYPGIFGSEINGITASGDRAFFFATSTDVVANELWISDGTAAGTSSLRAFNSLIQNAPVESNGTVFFTADDGTHGIELWKSDGTPGGTALVSDLLPGAAGSEPALLGADNGTAWFITYDDASESNSFWASDGTAAGTRQLLASTADIFEVTFANGLAYFAADDGVHGYELWRSDGTAAGTMMVADINSTDDNGSFPGWFAALNDRIYFAADDGIHGDELWTSDGTEQGTFMVADVDPVAGVGTIREVIAVDGTLYFYADDGIHGLELWTSDGTADGTRLVEDIYPGEQGSLTFFGEPSFVSGTSNVYFYVQDPDVEVVSGTEGVWWQSDGTETGTKRVLEDSTGLSQTIFDFMEINSTAVFLANTEGSGVELFSTAITTGLAGNIDGDNDFDANDSFLIHLVNLAGTNEQVNQSKGSSPLSASSIRSLINQIPGDVDGDNDFDANDSFLIHLVKLAGTNAQIDQSKGRSSLSAIEIRANVEQLGSGSSTQQQTTTRPPIVKATFVPTASPNIEPKSLIISKTKTESVPVVSETDKYDQPLIDAFTTGFRDWIDAI